MSDVGEWLFSNEPIRLVQELFGLGHPLPFRIFSLLGDTWGIVFIIGLTMWIFGSRATYPLVGIVVYEHLEVSSFPSGHVFAAVGPWGFLVLLGYLPFWAAALVAVLVSLGRLYLGTHYLGTCSVEWPPGCCSCGSSPGSARISAAGCTTGDGPSMSHRLCS